MIKAKTLSPATFSFPKLKVYLIDLMAITFIYFLPALSHLTALPLYYIEPMRLAVLFCLIHTSKKNAFLIAVTIPLFSLIVSSHPGFLKAVLITGELLINLWLFYFLVKNINVFTAAFLSIILSKLMYYSAKYLLIQSQWIDGGLVSTPLIVQLIIAVAISIYAGTMFKAKNNSALP